MMQLNDAEITTIRTAVSEHTETAVAGLFFPASPSDVRAALNDAFLAGVTFATKFSLNLAFGPVADPNQTGFDFMEESTLS